jgi:hypothetical protein
VRQLSGRPFASLDLPVITVITPETEQVLPAAELPDV